MAKKILALALFSTLLSAAGPTVAVLTPGESEQLELAALREAVVSQEIALLKARLAGLERKRAKAAAVALETFRLICEAHGLDPAKTEIAGDFKTMRGVQ